MYCGAGEGGNRDRQRSVNTMFADLRTVLVFFRMFEWLCLFFVTLFVCQFFLKGIFV